MNLKPFAALLEQNNCGQIGDSIFINTMKVRSNGLLLKDSHAGTKINYEVPGYYKGQFAVVARGTTFADTEALLLSAMEVLKIPAETQVGEMVIKYLRPLTLPISYPIPTSGQIEFVANIDCCFVVP